MDTTEQLYAAISRGRIIKIRGDFNNYDVVFNDPDIIAWEQGISFLSPATLMLRGVYKDGTYLVFYNTQDQTERKCLTNFPAVIGFSTRNEFLFIKDKQLYLSYDVCSFEGSKPISKISRRHGPFLMKVNESEVAFWAEDAGGKQFFSIYNIDTNSIRQATRLNNVDVSEVARTRTNDFFTSRCENGKCIYYLINEFGDTKFLPECVSESMPVNFIHYSKFSDSVYFIRKRLESSDARGFGETEDLYVYDFKSNKCKVILQSMFVRAVIEQAELNL